MADTTYEKEHLKNNRNFLETLYLHEILARDYAVFI